MQSGLISYLQKDIWKYFTKYEMGWYGPQFEFKFYIVIRLPRKGYQLTISNSGKFILKKTLAPIFVHQIFLCQIMMSTMMKFKTQKAMAYFHLLSKPWNLSWTNIWKCFRHLTKRQFRMNNILFGFIHSWFSIGSCSSLSLVSQMSMLRQVTRLEKAHLIMIVKML